MFQNKNLSVLASNHLLNGIDESLITLIFNSKNFRAEKEGELIFQGGDESNYLYLILQGEVKLKFTGTKRSNNSFRRVKNEFFGEQEVLEKTKRTSSAVADTDCIFYLISKEELFQLISKHRKILKNLSFIPQEENYEVEDNSVIEAPQEQNQNPEKDAEDKIVEEIIMDEDLADYSFDTPANEELHDFLNENYLSYDQNDNKQDLSFNNGFEPGETHLKENLAEEIQANHFQNAETSDILPEYPPLFLENNDLKEDDLVPAIQDFEHIPKEPEKFAFEGSKPVSVYEKSYNDEQQAETLNLVEGAAKFINNNILFPLNEIKKLSDLLSKHSSLPEALQVNELIKRHVDSVQPIVVSTMDFLSGENNQNLTKQNIKNVLINILNLLSEYVETRNVHLYKKIDTEIEVNINEVMLYNAFFQLAKNACDSMPDGGNIFVSAVKEDDKVKIEFIDEGIGIPSSITFEIFDPLVTHGTQSGTGLGLSIARKIIQDHNGNISVDAELGEGTRIVITLPF